MVTKQVILRNFPADLHKKVKIRAAQEETTVQGLIVKAVELYLKKKGGK